MKYPHGADAKIGDRVRFSNGDIGTIVLSVDTDEYTDEFPKEKWASITEGVLIKTDAGALVQYCDPNACEVFLLETE